jgi:cysteine desulfurase
MKRKDIYLDHAATTRPYDQVVQAVYSAMQDNYGNPSSLHQLGVEAEEALEKSREMIAASLQVEPGEVTFTSGGTETNNMVLKGVGRARQKSGKHIIASTIEHKSVLNTLQAMEDSGFEVTYVPVTSQGIIDMGILEEALREDTILVSIMHVNNETGAIQPIDQVADILRKHKSQALLHSDAVQSYGKIPLHPKHSGIDLLTVSSHKIHGPKGAAALYKGRDVPMIPLINGGEQERGLRSGTENLPAIVGFAKAVELNFHKSFEKQQQMRHLKDTLQARLKEEFDHLVTNTPEDDHAAPHILNVSFPGMKGEVLLHHLEAQGIFVSTGSACTSGRNIPSHVLNAMGIENDKVQGALRFSFSAENRQEDIEYVMEQLVPIMERLKKMVR